jgi:hypothetical protein
LLVYTNQMTNDPNSAETARQARLAAALRENLLRRKAKDREKPAPSSP